MDLSFPESVFATYSILISQGRTCKLYSHASYYFQHFIVRRHRTFIISTNIRLLCHKPREDYFEYASLSLGI